MDDGKRDSFTDKLPERFSIVRGLGSGGMGVVYEAVDRERDVHVAVKTLRWTEPEALLRLKKEFRSLQQVSHPNLVEFNELIEYEGTWMVTMELIHGSDFLTYVGRSTVANGEGGEAQPGRGYDETRLREASRQLAAGLAAIHDAGLVHRDVKPSNVLVTDEGRVVLLDFGLVADFESTDTTGQGAVGTVAYMAPEVARGVRDPAGDWYGVGTMLYLALTGRLPFDGVAVQVLIDKQGVEPPPPREVADLVPADLNSPCIDLLRTDPENRPSSGEILRRLGDHSRQAPRRERSHRAEEPLFVGRTPELAALRAAHARAAAGHAAIVCVTGESGVGKSALLAEFVRRQKLAEPRTVKLAGCCYEREQVHYKAFDGAIDRLAYHMAAMDDAEAAQLVPTDAGMLCRLFPVLRRAPRMAEVPLPRRASQDPHELRRRAFHALKELFERLSRRYPVVLAIDDIQWADPDSFHLLGELLSGPDAPCLLVLLSSRRAFAKVAPDLADVLDVEEIDLGRLPREAAEELAMGLLSQATATRPSPERAGAIAEEAGGHPLFISELARHAALGVAPTESAALEQAIQQRVAGLSETGQLLMGILAIADVPLSERALRAAAALDAATVSREVTVLRVVSLARGSSRRKGGFLEPYHDRVRKAVRAGLAEAELLALHRRLATALEATGAAADDPHALVRHYERAGDTVRAAQQAERAAGVAVEAFAFARAAQLYRSALRLDHTAGPGRQRKLRIAQAEALVNAGRGLDGAKEFLSAAEGADRTTRTACLTRAAESLLVSGHIERGMEIIETLLAVADLSYPRTARRALFRLAWLRARLRVRGLRWTEQPEKEIAPSDLLRLDICNAVGRGLAMVDSIRGMEFQARALLLALSIGERKRLAVQMFTESCFLGALGGAYGGRARSLLAEARRVGEPVEDPLIEAWSVGADGIVCFFEGQLARSAELLAQSTALFRERTVGTTWELNNTRMFRLIALNTMGQLGELRRLFDRYLIDALRRGDRFLASSIRRWCNRLWLAADRPEEALRDLERAEWPAHDHGYHLQHFMELGARAEVALYRGRAARAWEELAPRFRAQKNSQLVRIQTVRSYTAWVRGRLALAAAVDGGQPRLLKIASGAAKQLAGEQRSYSEVQSLLLQAGLAAQRGDRRGAAETLAEVVARADDAQMVLTRETARWQLGQLQRGDQAAEMIARAEEWLAAEGVINKARMAAMMVPGL